MCACFTVTEYEEIDNDQWGCHTFGLAAMIEGRLIRELRDVTVHREEAEEIAQKLNQSGVSTDHFFDIVYDWVTERAML